MNRRSSQVHADIRGASNANHIGHAMFTPKNYSNDTSMIKSLPDPTASILEGVEKGDEILSRYKSTMAILQNAINEVKDMMVFKFKEPAFIRYSPIYIPPLFLRRRFNLVVVTSDERDGSILKSNFLDETNMHIFMDIFLSTITSTPILNNVTGSSDSMDHVGHTVISIVFQSAFTLQMCTIAMNIMAYCSAVVVPNNVFYEWYVARIGVLHFILICHVAGFYLYVLAITAWPFLVYENFISRVAGSGVSILLLTIFVVRGGILDYVGKELDPLLESCKSMHTDEKLRAKAMEEVHLIGKAVTHQLSELNVHDEVNTKDSHGDLVMSTESFLLTIELSEKYSVSFSRENIDTVADIMCLEDADYLQLNVTIGDKLKIRRKLKDIADGKHEAKTSNLSIKITRFKSQLNFDTLNSSSSLKVDANPMN